MPSNADPSRSTVSPTEAATEAGKRSSSGSNYGDFAPAQQQAHRDPFRGAELERDSLPPDADFSGGHSEQGAHFDAQQDAESREERLRLAAYERYQRRGGTAGDALTDWLEAEAELGPPKHESSSPPLGLADRP